jgi:adenosylcobinamide kinase/adenosylcobinamide-phosphate guanylyltransferase
MILKRQVILVTGPARSGKSEWAEQLATQIGKPVIYVATARLDPDDLEWQARISKHRQRRSDHWKTLEVPIDLVSLLAELTLPHCLLIDSLGTWVANLLDQDESVWDTISTQLLLNLQHIQSDVILVAEETGWGVVPSYKSGRLFRDRLGTLTRQIGLIANPVYLVSGGYVLNLSELGKPIQFS